MPRLPEFDPAKASPEQRKVYDAIIAGPRGRIAGPLRAWLESPEFADHAQKLGAFCRFGTSLPKRLSELAILTTGRYWKAKYEWYAHAPMAIDGGLDKDIVEAIRVGKPPKFTKTDEAAVYNFARELIDTHTVSEPTYQKAVAAVGTKGVIEIIGILGYYTTVSMTLNIFDVPLPAGVDDPFKGMV